MNNKHNEFAEFLRNIVKSEEEKQTEHSKKNDEEYNENPQNLQELLEAKFDELFGVVDD